MTHHFRSKIRNREALAIDPRADILEMLMAEAVRPNEKLGDVCVLHVNGPLEHRACGYGDSYEQIRGRFQAALDAAPKAVVMLIDSPGGVVAGLNECVGWMQRAKEKAGIPVYAYADELIASAAYALACVADEIVTPPSGIVGSIGVISLLGDQVGADKKAGLNFVTITSGERKDDGHPHTTISDGAIAAETERVNELAAQFFALVEDARGFDPEPLQAGIFTGADAVAQGVADQVAGWDDLLAQIVLAHGGTSVSASAAPVHSGTTATGPSPHGESTMLKLKALLATARAALKAAKTEAKRKALKADISAYTRSLASLEAAYKKTTKTETKEEKTDDEEDDKGEEESAESEESEEESAEFPKKDEDESAEDDEASAESDDEEDSAEDEEPKKDAKRAGKAAAIAAKLDRTDKLEAEVARLRAADIVRRKTGAIAAALAGRRITKTQATMLAGKKLAFVTEFLSMHKTKLFLTDGEERVAREGDGFVPGGEDRPFSDEQMHAFRQAAAASGGKLTVDALIKNYKSNPTQPNGAGKY